MIKKRRPAKHSSRTSRENTFHLRASINGTLQAIITEVELRWITQRLLGAKRELARKGELRFFIPTGFVYDKGSRASRTDRGKER